MTGRNGSRSAMLVAAVALTGWTASILIYCWMIVPRLPTVRSVPASWWAGMFLPIAAAIVFAGYRSRSPIQAAVNSVAVAVPAIFVQVTALLAGAPITHDVWVEDATYWIGLAAQALFLSVLVAGVSSGFWLLRASWRIIRRAR